MVHIAAKRINFLLTASEKKLSSSWFVKRNCSLSSYCDIRLEALLEIPFISFNVPWDFPWNFPIWMDVSNLDSHARNCSSAEVKLSCSGAFGVFEHTIARFFKFVRQLLAGLLPLRLLCAEFNLCNEMGERHNWDFCSSRVSLHLLLYCLDRVSMPFNEVVDDIVSMQAEILLVFQVPSWSFEQRFYFVLVFAILQ